MRILSTQKPLQIYNNYDQMEVKIQKSHREALTWMLLLAPAKCHATGEIVSKAHHRFIQHIYHQSMYTSYYSVQVNFPFKCSCKWIVVSPGQEQPFRVKPGNIGFFSVGLTGSFPTWSSFFINVTCGADIQRALNRVQGMY